MASKKPEKSSIELARAAAGYLREIGRFMELKAENPFKVRAFSKAADAIEDCKDLKAKAEEQTLGEIPGIGKSLEEILGDYILRGKTTVRDEIKASLPEGLTELTQISGVGPKKALALIQELGIKSVGELEYACRENRLQHLKGFGEKVQEQILKDIQFWKSNQGQCLLPTALEFSTAFLSHLQRDSKGLLSDVEILEVGEVKRRVPIVHEISFLLLTKRDLPEKEKSSIQNKLEELGKDLEAPLSLKFEWAIKKFQGWAEAKATSSPEFWKALQVPLEPVESIDEREFFKKIGLEWIPVEMRESEEAVGFAKGKKISAILGESELQGIFHNHTHYSDGANSVEEMVAAARDLGFKYIGLSDHSQSAYYAQGLKLPDLKKQEKEIQAVREKYPDIRVFWGIESDILAEGDLDYEAAVLKKFDFVVASIHSRFKMDREAMTKRILKAVRNPSTTMVGHLTGRLLLGRPPYDLDVEKVIQAASEKGVAIELNSHPQRLDVDWHWGPQLRENKTWVCINPDAHEKSGLSDVRYGVWMARKALLPRAQILNTKSVSEIEAWLNG